MLLYTSVVSDGLVGRSYDVDTKVTKTLFTLPFKEATVRFNQSNSGSIYVYPKTAETLEGYLYEVSGGVLQRLPIAGYALNALTHNDSILYSAIKNNLLLSSLYNISTKESLYLPFIFIAEKCTFISGGNNIFCGVHQSLDKHSLFTWYQGALTTSDELWLVNTIDGAVTFLADPVELSGRSVDVTKASGSSDSARLYFINKTDQTLWLFDRSLSTVQ